MGKVVSRIIHDKMFLAALAAALLSLLISRPSLNDIDWQTILSLATLMMIVKVYEELKILKYGASLLVRKASHRRSLVQLLVVMAFFSSMFLTNDVAIITLVPILVLVADKVDFPLVFPVILINVAANLGSMVMPFGNPQNLFLLNHFHLHFFDFIKMSLVTSLASLLLLWLFSLRVAKKKVADISLPDLKIDRSKLLLTLAATVIVLLGIFAVIPNYVMLGTAVLLLFLVDRKLFAQIDYGLLLTFLLFFIAVGDLGRSATIHSFMEIMGNSVNGTYFSGLGLSQIISNVPAAILLAPYTRLTFPLFLGVNIGGLGTLVASLANLLAYKQYYSRVEEPDSKYIKVFIKVNLIFLLALGILGFILVQL